ncbi:hypothetical protein DHB74_08830 [Pseudomonas sp. G11-1]|uniref:Uncharacterized protein n=1 Tax=Halopseudomonas bauzanensis TaxID=653930 RepID=A0A1H9V902_9GAMM|nr:MULTISPECIES: hypothetical protein [Halopseudomonas]MCO5786452.1 hypothetical protein [Pseudomonas sp. G11-1]MCO5789678.1 hypothetical protein [Pseudomonas sp. G11-2]TKA92375.1 hypothetical protein FA869_08285 [Halopseudomonas bauzanensis]WGK62628.1 hypothetical protein QAO71_05160 [Halopseudomonas sp. SMJS2]SES17733.1 hypothetical protein SAMN05216589_2539 [Halopseudomonas bauzanensis]
MPVLQLAWLYYLNNSAFVLNCLALFYGLSGSWLIIATQWRTARAMRLATGGSALTLTGPTARPHPANRMFMLVGGVCLGLALLLTLAARLV